MSYINGDAEFLEAFLSGDRAAQRDFFSRYGGLIRYAVRQVRLCSNAVTEEDLFCGVIEHLLADDSKTIRQWEGRCSFSTYLYTVARRYALNTAARENRLSAAVSDVSLEEIPAELREEETAADGQELEAFRKAYGAMKVKDQLFVKMVYFDERTTEEVMSFFKWDSGTVYSQKNKIRAKLRKSVNKILFEKRSYAVSAPQN